jgi:hypothetical protein
MKSELAAFLIVAAKLDAMEEQVIHGNS